MARVAVEDLLERTRHELVLADLSVDRLEPWLSQHPDRVQTRAVDVRDGAALASALADADIVLNTTYMRYAVTVARAAIDAGVHLVDLGSYDATTLELLALDDDARRAGVRVVPGSGASPGLIGLLGRHGADQLTSVRSIELYSHLNDPIGTSPGIVLTRFESSVGDAPVREDGEVHRRACFADSRIVDFPAPVGPIRVYHLPHPEPITLPSFVDVPDVTYMLGYGDEEDRLVRALLDLGLDSEEPVAIGDASLSPAEFAAAVIGVRGIEQTRETVNAKHVVVSGTRDGVDTQLTYDLVVRRIGESASALITGVCAAIGTDLIAQGGPVGVVPAEGAFDPTVFMRALAERGFPIQLTQIAKEVVL